MIVLSDFINILQYLLVSYYLQGVCSYYLDRVCWLPLVLLKEQVGLDVVHHSGVLARAHVLGVLLGELKVPEALLQAVRAPALHRH